MKTSQITRIKYRDGKHIIDTSYNCGREEAIAFAKEGVSEGHFELLEVGSPRKTYEIRFEKMGDLNEYSETVRALSPEEAIGQVILNNMGSIYITYITEVRRTFDGT